MFAKWGVPKTIQWIIKLFLIYLCIFTVLRIATVVCFKPESVKVFQLLPSFWLGLKYDLRWIAIILLPISLVSLFPKLSPFFSERSKRRWTYYLAFITLLVLVFYGADFGQFAYINARLNADALLFAGEREGLQMVMQTYPVVWILIGLAGAVMMMNWMFRRTHVDVEERNISIHKFSFRKRWHFAAILLLGWFIYGFLTLQPLDFNRAFVKLNDEFKSNLALNPFQNFFATLKGRHPGYVLNKVKQFSPDVAAFVQDSNAVYENGYKRVAAPVSSAIESQPNIVLVLCESFSMYKSSMSGNPLNSTPYFNELCKNGIFFNRCFSPSFGTARGLFATITGTPDVLLSDFSTKNPITSNQRTIINDFKGYEKFYFIGGRSEFNNFKGLISNIDGVQIYDDGKYVSPKINVWGISDKNLFLEANKVMRQQQKPFFAIIQTADNHRPFHIPEEDKEACVVRTVNPDSLKRYGFSSQDEYNAFAYTDFSFKKFMESARQENYFNNTIFVFVGDHGVEGNAAAIYPAAWTQQRLSEEHVPLLFYAPQLLKPAEYKKAVSQIDILPTVAGMLQEPYTNSTLGRNILDSSIKQSAAFIIYHAPGWIGVVDDHFFYRKNLFFTKEELVPVTNPALILTRQQEDSVKRHLSKLTSAIYETSRWMLVNNKH